ncbi:MAG: NADP-dependent isocitrate dehydrogenase [Polyangiaceae bacterium]|jgi:isocitrate dehydrogenase|nr:NADP-dependent isocitrate dehydrogenase [Polyangiaceae bacterium]
MSRAVTYTKGDGIGPEIMRATLRVLGAAGADIAWEEAQVGEAVYRAGISSGIGAEAWESIRRTKVLLKAPITTPQGGGVKSLNVTMRKTLGLFANVRPCMALAPYVPTKHPGMDLVIVRENEEDLYAGIEHRQTDEVVQCLKLISRPGSERLLRYAFEYARSKGRRRVTCLTKDNIMKMTDGLFHRLFDEIGAEYPELEKEHLIVDIGTARVASAPERFDVIVLPNLYGDILSDVAAEVAGSVGMAGSANIGEQGAMFEAIHGSAPDIAGKGIANPSGLLTAATMLLRHIGQGEVAGRIQDAWLCALEDGIHTGDIATTQHTLQRVGTEGFADAIIARLGKTPRRLVRAPQGEARLPPAPARATPRPRARKELIGVDVFFHWDEQGRSPDALAARLQPLADPKLPMQMITNRGVKVWPEGIPETFCTDHWRVRFQGSEPIASAQIVDLLRRLAEAGLDFIKTEHLYLFDGKPGFSLGQGQ